MTNNTAPLKGIVRGKTIELEQATGLPDGQSVSVVVRPVPPPQRGDGLRRAFGSWADDAEGLDAFLDQMRRDRDQQRPEPGT
jgi:hypothetical protein